MIYLELLLGFLKVGLFSFGGGYAAVPLIRETVLAYGWLDDTRLSDLIAISESTPGPIMVNMATYVGATQGGIPGAIIATTASILPAFLIVILFMKLMQKAFKNEHINAALDGVKPAIAGLILATGVFMAANNIVPDMSFDLKATLLTAALALIYFGSRLIVKKGISPIVLILISAVAGVVLYA
jgi:chromate transporter